MSPEENKLLNDLFDRVQGAAGTPRDRDAEELIAQRLREQPYAAYYLAQAVIIQDHALQATTRRMQELEDHIQQLESEPRPQSTGFLGGLGTLFGNGQPSAHAPSRDMRSQSDGRLYDDYARSNREPEPAPGPWGRAGAAGPWSQPTSGFAGGLGGGGFLSGALTTAAGVAGGVLVADAVRDLFSSHVGGNATNLGGGLFGTGNTPVEETVVNNFFGDSDKSDRSTDRESQGSGATGSESAGNDRNDDDDQNDNNDDYDVDYGSDDDSSFV